LYAFLVRRFSDAAVESMNTRWKMASPTSSNIILPELKAADLTNSSTTLKYLLRVLAAMEIEGINLDEDYLSSLSSES
jgi:DNA polymerase I-like protein with 3'-5' exonuclease and polymerase domains